MIAKLETIQNTAIQNKDLTLKPLKQWEQQQTTNKQQQNHYHRTDSSRSHWGLKEFLVIRRAIS